MGALGLVVMPVGLVIKSDDYFLRMTRQLDSVEVSVNRSCLLPHTQFSVIQSLPTTTGITSTFGRWWWEVGDRECVSPLGGGRRVLQCATIKLVWMSFFYLSRQYSVEKKIKKCLTRAPTRSRSFITMRGPQTT